MSIIFLFWLHVIKPMIQAKKEVAAELQMIDQCVSYNGDFMNLKRKVIIVHDYHPSPINGLRMTPEDFIY